MEHIEHFSKLAEDTGRAVDNDDHPRSVEAIGGQEPRDFEVCCEPGDEGLILGAPGRQGTDPPGHTRFAAVLACKKPLPAAVTRVVREAGASAMARDGVGHD
jgi:hypothetical protein